MEVDEEQSPSKPVNTTLRAERNGIGALLASLRDEQTSSISGQPSAGASEEDDSDLTKTALGKPLNRREKRRLMREEFEEKQEKCLNVGSFPNIPTKFTSRFCDETSFKNYKASFGYEQTRTNNFVHLCLQNNASSCALVGSQDRIIRAYDISDNLKVKWCHQTGGLIMDILWEKSSDSRVFSSSKGRPIQLRDSENGDLLAAYLGKDSGDNIKEASCLGQVGNILIGGYHNQFQLWDVDKSKNSLAKFNTFDKAYRTGITGIPMSITSHPTMEDLFASAGTSSRLGIYSVKWNSNVATIEGSTRGYTNLKFSPDGLKLYASERSGEIHCFDTRMNMLTQVLKRTMLTTHRTRFDIDSSGRLLFSGTSTGDLIVYDLHEFKEEVEPVLRQKITTSCIPCVSVKNNKVLLCSGQRQYPECSILSDEVTADEKQEESMNTVQILDFD